MKKVLKTLVTILIIGFSSGCCVFNSVNNTDNVEWPMPTKPSKREINSIPVESGYIIAEAGIFLDRQDTEDLLYNLDQLDSYIQKLEFLIKSMKENNK